MYNTGEVIHMGSAKESAFARSKELSLKRNDIVYEPNPLLTVQDSMTSVWQHRFMRAYLCKVNPKRPETFTVQFSLQELLDAVDLKGVRSVKELTALAKAMMKVDFDFKEYRERYGLSKKGSKALVDVVNLFERFTIVEDEETGEYIVTVTPTRAMEDMLQGCQEKGGVGFVSYEVGNTLPMSKPHRMRLYELLKSNEDKGYVTISLDDLKAYVGLKDKYADVRNFNRLLRADLAEINKDTDITASFTTNGKGKGGAIASYNFIISAKDATPAKTAKPKRMPRDKKKKEELPDQTSMFAVPEIDDHLNLFIDALPRSLTRAQVEELVHTARKLTPASLLFDHYERDIWLADYFEDITAKMRAVKNLKSEIGWLRWKVDFDRKKLAEANDEPQAPAQRYSGYNQDGRRDLDEDELAAIDRLFAEDEKGPY